MGTDDKVRRTVAGIGAPEFAQVDYVSPRPLAECRVAIVTTAGLREAGGAELARVNDASFVSLPGAARDLQLAHFSPNFDRSGVVADINVVYPVDRLHELADAGIIGSVAARHLAFMGAQLDLSTLLLDSGPAAAMQLLADKVDVVVLTPV